MITSRQIEPLENNIRLQNSIRSTLNWFLRPESDHLSLNGYHDVSLIGNQISTSSCLFDCSIFNTEETSVEIERFDRQRYINKDKAYLSHIVEMYDFINKEMSDLVSHFILHGSMATLDYSKGWSDVDTFVVIPDKTLHNIKSLLKLRDLSYEAHKFLYRVDPLQHHGLIFASECDLRAYPSHYLPPCVFKKSVSMLEGEDSITLNIRNSKQESIRGVLSRIKLIKESKKYGVFRHHAYNGEYLLDNYRNFKNGMYQMKYYLGTFSIFPSLILGILDRECYKGDSFSIAKNLFSKDAWEVVDLVTEIRKMWPEKEDHPYRENIIPAWLRKELGNHYFSIGDKFLEEIEEICKERII